MNHLEEIHAELGAGQASVTTEAKRSILSRRGAFALAGALGVCAVILVLLLVLLTGRGTSPRKVGAVLVNRGKASLSGGPTKEKTGVQGKRMIVYAGNKVVTGRDSRATIDFEGGALARLDSTSSLQTAETPEAGVHVQFLPGNVYNRSATTVEYTIGSKGPTVSGGTVVFNINEQSGRYTITSTLGSVTIRYGGGRLQVREGYQVTVSRPYNIASMRSSIKPAERLDTPWFAWNAEQDRLHGLDPGILKPDQPTAPQPQQTAPVSGAQPQSTTPRHHEPAVPEPVAPAPSPPAQPQPVGTATLSVAAGYRDNTLNWKIEDAAAGSRVFVLRSSTNSAPTYPGDALAEVSLASSSYSDGSVSAGTNYFYRICVTNGSTPVFYSNASSSSIPKQAQVSASASIEGGSVLISWTSSANFEASGFAVVRSEDGTQPVYPPASGQQLLALTYTGPGGSVSDTSVMSDRTYSYRVAILAGSTPVAYSNTITVHTSAVSVQSR